MKIKNVILLYANEYKGPVRADIEIPDDDPELLALIDKRLAFLLSHDDPPSSAPEERSCETCRYEHDKCIHCNNKDEWEPRTPAPSADLERARESVKTEMGINVPRDRWEWLRLTEYEKRIAAYERVIASMFTEEDMRAIAEWALEWHGGITETSITSWFAARLKARGVDKDNGKR